MATVLSGGQAPVASPLTSDEKTLLDEALAVMSYIPGMYRDLGELLNQYSSVIQSATEYAKNTFNLPFGGALPDQGQFGIRYIRAETALAKFYNGAPQNVPSLYWKQNINSAGWTTLFNVDLSYTGATGYPASNLKDNYTVLALGILDPNVFEHIVEYQIAMPGKTYPVLPTTVTQISDLSYIPFIGAVYISKEGSATIYANFDQPTVFNGRLFGVEFYVYQYGLNQQ
ncbi:MAG: hypothetical protein ACP5MW_06745 [Thermoplasmata archaeon]